MALLDSITGPRDLRDLSEDQLTELAAEYDEQVRGFELRNVAGGWRYYTREEFAPVVERFVLEGQQTRLTQAALETLAVVAYKQPVSRARVSGIRAVHAARGCRYSSSVSTARPTSGIVLSIRKGSRQASSLRSKRIVPSPR